MTRIDRHLMPEEPESMFGAAGMSDVRRRRCVLNDAEAWMEISETSYEDRAIIRNMLDHKVGGGKRTGFQPVTAKDG